MNYFKSTKPMAGTNVSIQIFTLLVTLELKGHFFCTDTQHIERK